MGETSMMTDPLEIRKVQTKPRFGLFSFLSLVAILVGQTSLALHAVAGLDPLAAQIWVGLMWGGWAISLWVLLSPPLSLGRSLSLGCCLAWHVCWMSLIRELPPTRYLILFGSFGILLAVLGIFAPLPAWSWGRTAPLATDRRPPQFGILTILVVTTAVALLMFAVRSYIEDLDDPFLSGTGLVAILLATVGWVAMLSSRTPRGIWLGPLVLIPTSGIAAWLLATIESATANPTSGDLWSSYQLILTVYGMSLWFFGTCGRWDAEIHHSIGKKITSTDLPS